MKLHSYIYITYAVAAAIVVGTLVFVMGLVAEDTGTLESMERNQSIYRSLYQLNIVLVDDSPPVPADIVTIAARAIDAIRALARIENDYVLMRRLFEANRAVEAWMAFSTDARPSAVQRRSASQVRLHVLEAMTAVVDIITTTERAPINNNRRMTYVGLTGLLVILVLFSVVVWVFYHRVLNPFRGVGDELARYVPGSGAGSTVRSHIREVHDFQRAFQDMDRRLMASFREIEDREARYRSLFLNSAYGVVVFGEDRRVEDANEAACAMLDRDSAVIRGANIGEFLSGSDLDLGPTDVHPERSHGTTREITMRIPNGDDFPAEASASSFRDPNGGLVRMLVFQNISERKTLEAQHLQSRRMETIGTFARGIAHDFNNILMPLMPYSSMLQRQGEGEATVKQYAIAMQRAVTPGAALGRQITAFSRVSRKDAAVQSLDRATNPG